jgi:hypothetical protein
MPWLHTTLEETKLTALPQTPYPRPASMAHARILRHTHASRGVGYYVRAHTHDVHAWLKALEARGDALAAEVEDEAEVDGDVEVEPQHVGLDGRAEAHGGFELHEPVQQRAARLVHRHADLGLDQIQHVGAHAELQRVCRAMAVPAARAIVATATAPTSTATATDGAVPTTAAASDGSDPTAAASDGSDPTAAATITDRTVPSSAAAATTTTDRTVPSAAAAPTWPAAATGTAAMPTAAMVPAATVAIVARAVRAGVGRREEQEVEDEEQWHLAGRHYWSRACAAQLC